MLHHMCFLQKKINIQLKYFPGKFGNSGESNSCHGSLVNGSKFRRFREKTGALVCIYSGTTVSSTNKTDSVTATI